MLCKLALGNLRRNFHNYWAYFLSSAFSVFVLYLFLSIVCGKYSSPAVNQATAVVFAIGAVLAGLFAAFFIWYSNSFFIKSRKKEFATYMLLGMSKGQTVRLSFLESFAILVLAYAAGIAAGILLDKFLIMLLFSIMQERAYVPFEINLQALKVCSYVYGGVFVLVLLHSARLLNKNSLVELINASRKSEKGMKASPKTLLLGVLAIGFIGTGYYFAIAMGGQIILWPVVVAFVCIGTALLFTGLATLFFHFARKNETSLYRGTRLVTVSQLMHRYRGNVGALSIIAITTSVALCAVLTCCGIFGKTEDSTRSMHPFSVQYASSPQRDAAFEETLKEHPEVSVRTRTGIRLLYGQIRGTKSGDDHPVCLIGQTDYNEALAAEGRKDFASLPDEGSCLYVQFLQNYSGNNEFSRILNKNLNVLIGGKALNLKVAQTILKTYLSLGSYLGKISLSSSLRTIVVADDVYNTARGLPGVEEFGLTGYMLQNDLAAGSFIADLDERIKPFDDQDFADMMKDKARKAAIGNARYREIDAFYPNFMDNYKAMGVLMFVGVFIGLLFIAATGSILYFRMTTEAAEDREKYAILQKIGMNARELRGAVAKELAIVFGAPLVVAAANAFAASYTLEWIVGLGMKDMLFLIIAVYALFYGSYYLLALNKYVKTVGQGA